MRKILVILVLVAACMAGVLCSPDLYAAEKPPQKVIDLANTTFIKWSTDSVIVKAVQEENGKNKTMDQIKEMDKKWQATPGIVDYMKALIDSPCGKHLLALQNKYKYIAEIFVMDNQGATVAMTDKTSDYWQGDEAKFTESYKNGKGALHISDVTFDDSTQAYLVQVSIPVKSNGKAIGAITIGVDVDQVEKL